MKVKLVKYYILFGFVIYLLGFVTLKAEINKNTDSRCFPIKPNVVEVSGVRIESCEFFKNDAEENKKQKLIYVDIKSNFGPTVWVSIPAENNQSVNYRAGISDQLEAIDKDGDGWLDYLQYQIKTKNSYITVIDYDMDGQADQRIHQSWDDFKKNQNELSYIEIWYASKWRRLMKHNGNSSIKVGNVYVVVSRDADGHFVVMEKFNN